MFLAEGEELAGFGKAETHQSDSDRDSAECKKIHLTLLVRV